MLSQPTHYKLHNELDLSHFWECKVAKCLLVIVLFTFSLINDIKFKLIQKWNRKKLNQSTNI